MSDTWICSTCGEAYQSKKKKLFVNYCCKEQAYAKFDKAMKEVINGLQDLAAIQELDKSLKGLGIKPLEESADG